ncbi:MAG: division/cell wall cluster transcriptional repressor MraZ [Hyphomonadaceae bacterium]|nr:division/cell wall cluster transcriptional repressor MraZ [Clostridia bacterium]
MFMGEYSHTIDAKGRMSVPSKMREALGEKYVVSKGLDGCLYIFSETEWEKFAEKLSTLPWTLKDSRTFKRYFFSGATECEADKQGRISLPNVLRDHAGLQKEVVVIGVDDRAEIWSRDNWEAYNNGTIQMDEISEKMAELGIL